MPPEQHLLLTRDELNTLVEDASERGAKRALKMVGLDDPHALRDIMEARSLLEAWRAVKTGALTTVGRLITVGVLSAIAAYFFVKH
jgi:hypothetical protein